MLLAKIKLFPQEYQLSSHQQNHLKRKEILIGDKKASWLRSRKCEKEPLLGSIPINSVCAWQDLLYTISHFMVWTNSSPWKPVDVWLRLNGVIHIISGVPKRSVLRLLISLLAIIIQHVDCIPEVVKSFFFSLLITCDLLGI